MTRIAAGQPDIWPDICDDNADAIVETLDLLVDALRDMRRRVAEHDRASLLDVLGRAAVARRALAERTPQAEELVEVRVPVPDRPKVLAEITTLAAELGVQYRRPRDRPLGGGGPRGHAPGHRRERHRPVAGRAGRSRLPLHPRPGGAEPVTAETFEVTGGRALVGCAPGPRGQVDLPSGPVAGGAGRGHLYHHRPLRRRRRAPHPGGGRRPRGRCGGTGGIHPGRRGPLAPDCPRRPHRPGQLRDRDAPVARAGGRAPDDRRAHRRRLPPGPSDGPGGGAARADGSGRYPARGGATCRR